MRTLMLFALAFFNFGAFGYESSVSTIQRFAPSEAPQQWSTKSSMTPVPTPSPTNRESASPSSVSPLPQHHHHHHHHHHHRKRHHALSPSPSSMSGCDQVTCFEPFTSAPIGSPCGCVVPMQVELHLGVAPYTVFPLVVELEIEVAAGTYLKQSQVRIMGANADSNQGRTIVDINLVPLGDKFDTTTALLTSERFWQKKVPINMSLFGDYGVVYIRYPGLPSSLPPGDSMGIGPNGSQEDPIMANFDRKSRKMNARTIIIIALSASILLLVCIGAFFILLRCKKHGRPSTAVGPSYTSSINKRSGIRSFMSSGVDSSTAESLISAMATCILSVKTFPLAEIEKATEKFSSKRILGEGGFGRVYHGALEDGTEVAVKLLTREDQNGDREFIAEVEMLSRLHHRNLVKLIGTCVENRTRCLVYEVVHNGSVESHLHGADKKTRPLDWDARMKIALGSARGLAYLHEDSNPRVIHRDFKASNVLLQDDFTPKVSDFGLAREATEGSHHISTRVMGTFGYVAPEYAMTGHLLVKSDVYSYGVVLLELLTGRKPVDMSQPQGEENLVTWARPLLSSREGLEKVVDPALSGNFDFDNMAKVAAIASMCVHPEVTQRPFMGEVVQALKLIYNDIEETCEDFSSQKESSESEFKGDIWGEGTPRLKYGYASSFITMDYSSGPLEDMENRALSPSSLDGGGKSLPAKHINRSGPLRTTRKPAFYRLRRGSMSEHGGLPSSHVWTDGYWA